MSVTETVSLIEILWTAPAVIGFLFTSWLALDLWRDRRALRRSGWNGLARLQVERWLRSELLIVACHGIFTAVGLFAMTQPSSTPGAAPTLIGLMLTGLFIFVPTLLVIRSIGDRIARRVVRRQVREHRP